MLHGLRSGWVRHALSRAVVACAIVLATAAGSGAFAFDLKAVEASVYKIFSTPKGTLGTGFLVSGRRTVITNFHVIENNAEFMVIYREGKEVQTAAARVIAYNPKVDLAVLRVDRDLPGRALVLAEFEPEKLTDVITVGFPAAADVAMKGKVSSVPELLRRVKDPGLMDATVTSGTVSRMTSTEHPTLAARAVQHNAAINPGNSGGPLFDKCGNLLGVNTLVALNSQGLFFSIHATEVGRILRENGIEYAAAQKPCVISDTAGSSMMLPMVIGMSLALALAAVVFALRSGASLGPVSRVVSRFTRPRERPAQKQDAAEPRRSVAQQVNWAKTAPAMSLQPAAGGRSFALDSGRSLVVGRGAKSQITVDDDTVSGTHARLQVNNQGDRVTVTDLNSSNGTYHNGSRITSASAEVGDVLRFGTAEFRLAVGSVTAAPTPRSGPVDRGWMLSGFDTAGRALQFELRPMVENGSASEAATTWVFGRDRARAQFVIDDSSVSGAHAEITYAPDQGLTLRDLGSTNGTRIDGEPIGKNARQLDETGQEITFGAAKLRLSRLV